MVSCERDDVTRWGETREGGRELQRAVSKRERRKGQVKAGI